jgi:hypothetical protein
MMHTVTVSVTFKVLADDCSKAEHAAFDAIEAIPLVDGITGTSYALDDSTLCQHDEEEADDEPSHNDAVLCCPDCEKPNQFGEQCLSCMADAALREEEE